MFPVTKGSILQSNDHISTFWTSQSIHRKTGDRLDIELNTYSMMSTANSVVLTDTPPSFCMKVNQSTKHGRIYKVDKTVHDSLPI